MGESDGFSNNLQRFLSSLELIIEKYSQTNEDDLVINLEDMTYDSPSGPEPWCPEQTYPRRKTTKNSSMEKSAEMCESESLSQTDLTSSVLSGEADGTLNVDILKDRQWAPQGSKVECLGKTKSHKPLLSFSPQSKKISSRPVSLDCCKFQETFSGDFGCSSPKFIDNKKDYSDSSISNLLFENSTTSVPDSKELDSLKFAENSVSASIDASVDQSFVNDDVSSSLSDTTLVDVYPGMLLSMSNLLERSYRTHTATRLVKHYRHLQMNVNKSRHNTTQDRRVRRKTPKVFPQLKKMETQGTLLGCEERIDCQLADRKVYSLTKYKPRDNLEQRFSAPVAGDFRTMLQAGKIGALTLPSLYREAACSPTIQLASRHSSGSVSIVSSQKTEVSNAASPNGSSLHKLNTPPKQGLRRHKRLVKLRLSPNFCRLSSTKALTPQCNVALAELRCSMPVNSQSDEAMAQSPRSTLGANVLPNAESSATLNDSPLAEFSPSSVESYKTDITNYSTSQTKKRRHSVCSFLSPNLTVRCCSQRPLKMERKDIDAFERLYQQLVRSPFSLSSSVKSFKLLKLSDYSVPCSSALMTSSAVSPSELSRQSAMVSVASAVSPSHLSRKNVLVSVTSGVSPSDLLRKRTLVSVASAVSPAHPSRTSGPVSVTSPALSPSDLSRKHNLASVTSPVSPSHLSRKRSLVSVTTSAVCPSHPSSKRAMVLVTSAVSPSDLSRKRSLVSVTSPAVSPAHPSRKRSLVSVTSPAVSPAHPSNKRAMVSVISGVFPSDLSRKRALPSVTSPAVSPSHMSRKHDPISVTSAVSPSHTSRTGGPVSVSSPAVSPSDLSRNHALIAVTSPVSPAHLSRKITACSDLKGESSHLSRKRFRSLPEPSVSREFNPERMELDRRVQTQTCRWIPVKMIYSPSRTQSEKKAPVLSLTKWREVERFSAGSSGLAIPVIDSSGNTMGLHLSPRIRHLFQKRVSRKLDYTQQTCQPGKPSATS